MYVANIRRGRNRLAPRARVSFTSIAMRFRLLSAIVASFGVTFVSFSSWSVPQSARAAQTDGAAGPLDADVVTGAGAAVRDEAAKDLSFSLEAINIRETVLVRCPGPSFEPDADSFARAQHLLRAVYPDKEGKIDPKLLIILRDIAQATGGKIQVISAYRRPGWRGDHNFHVRGQAADIRVPGVSTRKLRDLAKSLGVKGVGYYPTSQMVHVDAREEPYFWTDWSGPSVAR